MRDYLGRRWLAVLVLVLTLLTTLAKGGPTFSANDHSWTMPGWIYGTILSLVVAGYLARCWRRERAGKRDRVN